MAGVAVPELTAEAVPKGEPNGGSRARRPAPVDTTRIGRVGRYGRSCWRRHKVWEYHADMVEVVAASRPTSRSVRKGQREMRLPAKSLAMRARGQRVHPGSGGKAPWGINVVTGRQTWIDGEPLDLARAGPCCAANCGPRVGQAAGAEGGGVLEEGMVVPGPTGIRDAEPEGRGDANGTGEVVEAGLCRRSAEARSS